MDHAHPTPEPSGPIFQHVPHLSPVTDKVIATHSAPTTPSPAGALDLIESPLSLQHRRLQLRNSGFRGTRFPSHRISGLSRWKVTRNGSGDTRNRNQENEHPTLISQGLQARHDNKPSILQEVTNSTRSRHARKKPNINIFEDPQEESLPRNARSPSASNQSPQSNSKRYSAISSLIEGDDIIMLRELSGNEGTPPSNPALAKKARKRGKAAISPRDTSYDVSRYIEHLESQLALFQQSMTSPRTGRPMHKKVRTFSQENKRLRETVDEWEDRFDLRVKEAIEHQAITESDLRRKIKTLEDEISLRDSTIGDLRYSNERTMKDIGNLESLRLSIVRLENSKDAVEATNKSLEKRNDVLTELLAQSPTRSCHSFDIPPTSANSNAWSTPRPRPRPRPRSMMPRLPSSPHSPHTWRPLSVQVSPATASELGLLDEPLSGFFDPASPGIDDRNLSDQAFQPACFGNLRSLAVGSESSQSASQRSSIVSQSLDDPSVTDLPLPLSSPESKAERANRNRRSRRFAPGSTSLKPLLLPTLHDDGSTASSPTQPRSIKVSQTSKESMDSVAAMVSSSDAYETPTQPKRHSSKGVDIQTLRALEGASERHFSTFEEVLESDERAQSNPSGSRSHRLASDDIVDIGDLIPRSLAFAKSRQREGISVSTSCSTQASDESNQTEMRNTWGFDEPRARHSCNDFRLHATLRPTSSLSLGSRPESEGHEPTKKQRPPIPRGTPYRFKREKPDFNHLPFKPLQPPHLRSSPSEKAHDEPKETQQHRPSAANALTIIPSGGNIQRTPRADPLSPPVQKTAAIRSVGETESGSCEAPFAHQRGTKTERTPANQPDEAPVKGWRRSIYLWGRFSFAIALAIGGALVKGPEEMLQGCDHYSNLVSNSDGNCDAQSPPDARHEVSSAAANRCAGRNELERERGSDPSTCIVRDSPPSPWLSGHGRSREATNDVAREFSRNTVTMSTPTRRPSTAPESLDYHHAQVPSFDLLSSSRNMDDDDYDAECEGLGQFELELELDLDTPTKSPLMNTTRKRTRMGTKRMRNAVLT
ncbi:MAG: hypothetical protein Q9160_000522 [Pyrenula sp. 1 TL-2023]